MMAAVTCNALETGSQRLGIMQTGSKVCRRLWPALANNAYGLEWIEFCQLH
jgi:hypothetical protein